MVHKWIQEVVGEKSFKEGSFTAQAVRHGMTPTEFMKYVLAHPDKFIERTRKRAQFMKNIMERRK